MPPIEGGYFHCLPDLAMVLNSVLDQAKGKGARLFSWMHGMPAL